MKFEEQFPSPWLTDWSYYFANTIQRYCLDKQKVKDAVKELSRGPPGGGDFNPTWRQWRDRLMEKLGLVEK